MVGETPASGDSEESSAGQSGESLSAGDALGVTAVALDEVTGGRVSTWLFIGVLGLPLGCAFIVSALALSFLFGGAVVLIGLNRFPVVNYIALGASLIGAVVVVVLVYRKLIPRLPWLRDLINR